MSAETFSYRVSAAKHSHTVDSYCAHLHIIRSATSFLLVKASLPLALSHMLMDHGGQVMVDIVI